VRARLHSCRRHCILRHCIVVPAPPTAPRAHRAPPASHLHPQCAVGDAATVKTICGSFVKRTADTLKKLEQMWETKDWKELRRHAHSLKGASSYIGSEMLRGDALALQEACEVLMGDDTTATEAEKIADVEQKLNVVRELLPRVNAAIVADQGLKGAT
jgi:HPt (histidine-containing phosphotransfer) domain-containing protein